MTTNTDSARAKTLDERLERLLMRKRTIAFELWQALALGLSGIAAIVLFGALALEGTEKDAALPERAAFAIADAPHVARRIISDAINDYSPRLARGQRFKGEQGWKISPAATPNGLAILLSRFDGDEKRGVVELVDLSTSTVVHSWRPDVAAINAQSKLPESALHLKRDYGPRRYMLHHPFPLEDGSLIYHGMGSPLVRIDACSRLMWTVDGDFHHSIERDADGNFWTVDSIHPPSIPFVDDEFDDDAVVKVSPDGAVLFRKSAAQMLIEAGLGHIVYSHDVYDADPVHLNDVQPALADGPYWKKGDIFISLRNPSMITLYRPSSDELVWSKQGPWLMQHDVDIISDHEIAVFNNNTAATPAGGKTIENNNVVVYDFATGETSEPFAAGFSANRIHTETNGLFRFLPDGSLMVEEHDYGRLLAIDRKGDALWSYVNRAPKDGRVYHLGWSRTLEGARAAQLKKALSEKKCEG